MSAAFLLILGAVIVWLAANNKWSVILDSIRKEPPKP